MKEGFATIGKELKKELNEVTVELSWHREELNDIIGFEDNVRGFDLEFMTDDSIDFLDLYSQFLGYIFQILISFSEVEYFKMKENYQKALSTMNEVYQIEIERLRMSSPISYEELS